MSKPSVAHDTIRTTRIPVSGGLELRIALWSNEDGGPEAVVFTKCWPEEPATPCHRDPGQVAVPAELISDIVAALEELKPGTIDDLPY